MDIKEWSLADSYEYCHQITKRSAKNFYYAFLTLPSDLRRALYTTYAFCRVCDDVADNPDISVPQKLKEIENLRAGLEQTRNGQPRGPIFLALRSTVLSYGIQWADLAEVLQGVHMDLTINRYRTFKELQAYCYKVASAVGLICIQVLGYRDQKKARQYAEDFGLAMQLTNILRDIREDMDSGRIYLPLEDMDRFSYTEDDLRNRTVNEHFIQLMRFQISRARQYFQEGKQLLPLLPLRSRACVAVLGGLYSQILVQIENRQYDVFTQRISLSTKRKTWLTIKIAAQTFIPFPSLSMRW